MVTGGIGILDGEQIRAMFGGGQREEKPKTEPMFEALEEDFMNLCDRYVHGYAEMSGLPFKRKDMVMFRRGYAPEGLVERPAVVVEVAMPLLGIDIWGPDGSMQKAGRRADTRVVVFDEDHHMVAFWAESWTLAPYVPPSE